MRTRACAPLAGDESTDVAGYVIKCVHVVGACVEAKRWLPLALDHLAKWVVCGVLYRQKMAK